MHRRISGADDPKCRRAGRVVVNVEVDQAHVERTASQRSPERRGRRVRLLRGIVVRERHVFGAVEHHETADGIGGDRGPSDDRAICQRADDGCDWHHLRRDGQQGHRRPFGSDGRARRIADIAGDQATE